MNDPKCAVCGRHLADGDEVWRYASRKVTLGQPGEETDARLADTYDCADCIDSKRKGQLLRITSRDDTAAGVTARLVQPDGTEVVIGDLIESITWTVSPDTVNTAVITFNRVELDVHGRLGELDVVTSYVDAPNTVALDPARVTVVTNPEIGGVVSYLYRD